MSEDQVSPGMLGFLVVVAMGAALFFLIRSMNKQISRIQAPREADLKQAEWEQRHSKKSPGESGGPDDGDDKENTATSGNGTRQD